MGVRAAGKGAGMHEQIAAYKEKVEDAVRFLEPHVNKPLDAVIILGTGLGGLAKQIEAAQIIPYTAIPNFPESTVASHAGNLIIGLLGGKQVAALQGRFHYYEGYGAKEVTFPVRVLSLLGAKTLIVSNAAGGLNPHFEPGSLMIIRDHINFMPENPLRGPNVDEWGPRFPDLSQPYDPLYMDTFKECARKLQAANVTTGVYVAIPGPSLETPAETRFLRASGGDAVGMSTVPEVIVAGHAGMRVLGVSVIANVNDPENFKPILLEEVIAQTKEVGEQFQQLMVEFLKAL